MLSVVDIQNKEFKRNKIGGYNIDEVNEYLEQIIKSYQQLLNENYDLQNQVDNLNKSVKYYHTMESTIQNVLVLADKTAQDTKAAAYDKAEQIKKEADRHAEQMTALAEERVAQIVDEGRKEAYELAQKVEETKSQFINYKNQFKQLLQMQMEVLEQGDVIMSGVEENLSSAFSKIKEDTNSKEQDTDLEGEEMEQEVENEDEAFYTKEYAPLSNVEIEELLKNNV